MLLASNVFSKIKTTSLSFCGQLKCIFLQDYALILHTHGFIFHVFAKTKCNGLWFISCKSCDTVACSVFVNVSDSVFFFFVFTLDLLFPSLLELSVCLCLWNIVPVGGSRHFIMNKMYYYVVEGENMKYS